MGSKLKPSIATHQLSSKILSKWRNPTKCRGHFCLYSVLWRCYLVPDLQVLLLRKCYCMWLFCANLVPSFLPLLSRLDPNEVLLLVPAWFGKLGFDFNLELKLVLWRDEGLKLTIVYCFFFSFPIFFFQCMMSLVLAGCAAATAIGYVGRYGNNHAGWMAICDQFDEYCNRIRLSLMFSYLAFVFILMLTIMSANKSREIQVWEWLRFSFCTIRVIVVVELEVWRRRRRRWWWGGRVDEVMYYLIPFMYHQKPWSSITIVQAIEFRAFSSPGWFGNSH